MPFVGDVFGLNAVYDRQVLNVEKRNVLNWPEYPTYGYFVGGTSVNAPAQSSTITRLDLATNVGSLPGRNLPVARIDIVSISNNFYGYIAGGALNTLVRLDFSNETSSIPGKNFTANSRTSQAAVSNLLYGYFGGGYAPALASTISRLEFSSETVSNPNINLSPSRARFAAVSSSTYGYFGGGYTPTLRSTITRLDFTNETLVDPGNLNLPTGIGDHSALSNISYGYFGGGSGVCTINRLDFSNETVSAPGKNLPTIRRGPLAFSSSTATGSLNGSYGYFGGGGVPTGSGITDIIEQLDFATENVNTLTATLGQQVRSGAAVANSGSSFRTNSKTYGYYAGGFAPPSINTISRLDFSNETVSSPGNNLPTARYGLAATSSSSYGYFGGGYTPPYINTITRLDFSNETVSDPGKNLPTARSGLAATSSSSYGYFGGGESPNPTPPPAFIRINTISRLDFSNETVSNPGKNLPTSRDLLAAVSSSSYGYFGGGFTPPYINTISRLDFSNETVSDPGKNLPSAGGSGGRRSQLAAISNNSYGYFGGGANPAGFNSCTISRLDFSNETATDPGKNLSAPSTFIAAVSNNFYGYFGGGSGVCTINRLDFSNETVSAPGKNLPTIRYSFAGLSNSN